MTEQTDKTTKRPSMRGPLFIVAVAAIAMGLPTVRGGFVGGDDHRLALDHVLVNRPSLDHAVQLFAIAHRDLYQPLPLLSFSAEFLICDWLGLTRGGPGRFAWFFHLNNVWLHAINAVLVWLTVSMLQRRVRGSRLSGDREFQSQAVSNDARACMPQHWVPTIVALIFAVHPLNTEVVAWVNGRMMLLSTMFGLLSLLAFDAWLRGGRIVKSDAGDDPHGGSRRYWLIPAIIVLTLFCSISKIRIGLPVLMLIVAWAGRDRIVSRRFLPLLLVCTAITGVFVAINVQATAAAELFVGGSEHLHGPRLIRVISALAFYFTHYLYPIGLASYYPTPPTVSWSDATTWHALLIVIPSMALLGFAAWRSRSWRLGVLWFFATIAATLPFMPARNVLAADRYMYLPIIGLLWPTADLLYRLWTRVIARTQSWIRKGLVPSAVVVVVLAMIGQCWNVAWYYESPLQKTMRVAMLFPDVPRVWERLGWSYYEIGEYERAAELATKELVHDAADVQSGAYQLIGMSAFKRGQVDEALASLRKALEVDPDNALGKYRLATIYDDTGHYEQARSYFEQAVEAAPKNNPTIHRLAAVYRKLRRPDDARRLYEQAIDNNAFDVDAFVGLAELAAESGDAPWLEQARDQLSRLLEHIPDATPVWVTLGIVEVRLGRVERAVEVYKHVLSLDPKNVAALLNLAELLAGMGDIDAAVSFYDRASRLPLDAAHTKAVSDFYLDNGQFARSKSLWDFLVNRNPQDAEARLQRAWVLALIQDVPSARAELNRYERDAGSSVRTIALRSLIALTAGQGDEADSMIDELPADDLAAQNARNQLLSALERFDRVSPGNEWTYYLVARLLEANANRSAARASLEIAAKFCTTKVCTDRVNELARRFEDAPSN